MKTAIIYYSKEHGNTKKLVDAIAGLGGIDIYDVTEGKIPDLDSYECIGFASGVYYASYHKSLQDYVQENLPDGKKVFFLHTGGNPKENNNQALKAITDKKKCEYLGTYFTKGYDTYGPFKLVGGIAKGHPNDEEIRGAASFYKGIASLSQK